MGPSLGGILVDSLHWRSLFYINLPIGLALVVFPRAVPRSSAPGGRLPDVLGTALLGGAPWTRLVAIGDSVAEGVRAPATGYLDLSWVDRIARALRPANPDLTYRNLGERNLLAAEVRERQLAPALALAPDLAIIACGGNDMLRSAFDTDGVKRELDTMIGALRSTGSDVLTIGLVDITGSGIIPERYAPSMSAGIRRLGAITEEVAADHGALYISFIDHPASADPGSSPATSSTSTPAVTRSWPPRPSAGRPSTSLRPADPAGESIAVSLSPAG